MNSKPILLAGILVCFFAGSHSVADQPTQKALAASSIPQQLDDGWDTPSINGSGLNPELLSLMTQFLEARDDLNVHAILIEHVRKLVFEHYFSGADERWGQPLGDVSFSPETKHDLRSITKSVVSALVGLALHNGDIASLDTHEDMVISPEFQHACQVVVLIGP